MTIGMGFRTRSEAVRLWRKEGRTKRVKKKRDECVPNKTKELREEGFFFFFKEKERNRTSKLVLIGSETRGTYGRICAIASYGLAVLEPASVCVYISTSGNAAKMLGHIFLLKKFILVGLTKIHDNYERLLN